MSEKNYITKEGYKEMKEELAHLKDIKRVDVASKIKDARDAGGDILENSVYDAAVEEQAFIENRINEIEDVLANSKILEDKASNCDKVGVGCVVLVELEKEQHEFKLVGSVEADPDKKYISNESPVGQALLGAVVGDVVSVETPTVTVKYKILQIS